MQLTAMKVPRPERSIPSMSRDPDFGNLTERMKELAERSYVPSVERLRGSGGVNALMALLAMVKKIWHHVAFEAMSDGLSVRYRLDEPEIWDATGTIIHDPSELSSITSSGLTIEILAAGRLIIWPDPPGEAAPYLPGIEYRYRHPGLETLHLDGETWDLPNSAWPCSLAIPTYSRLEDALVRYVELNRRPEYCAHIAQSWRDAKRLAFAPKPEAHLRRSLFIALRQSIEGAMVRQEQNQDETKPVDIEITWWSPARSAIIEVKWMGRSGPPGGDRWSTSYDHKRARDGLDQLCDYLDRRDGSTPNHLTMGYIFVFDAMRENVQPSTASISSSDGLKHRLDEISYPQQSLDRPDVGRPFRCFLEPIIG